MTADAPRISVLVIEDSSDHRLLMERYLRQAGVEVSGAASGEEALSRLDGVDVVLLDQGLPGLSGIDTLREIVARRDAPAVVMVTGQGSTDLAVEAMRDGAIDYVSKNAGYLRELPRVVERAWRQHDLARRAAELQRLGLLMHAAESREELIGAIVAGARRLARCRAAALLEHGDDGLDVIGLDGDPGEALAHVREALPKVGAPVVVGSGDVVVALPADDGEPYGVLACVGRETAVPTNEELELAEAFASFAAVALRNLRRRELESALIAELTQTIEARRDFVASVSHELRTPLTSIAGFADTLLENWDRLDDARRRDFLGHVRVHAGELHGIVDRLIDVAAMERGVRPDVEAVTVDVREATDAAVAELARQLADRVVTCEVPEGLRVRADQDLLHRTLVNLLSNAGKFSPAGTPITVSVTVAGTDQARVTVRDRGVGLEPREAARVFDPFWRARYSVANAVRGSGIGLALVREYVRSMGGEVEVESAPGQGAAFSFTVPLA